MCKPDALRCVYFTRYTPKVLLDIPESVLLSRLCSAWLEGTGLHLTVMPAMVAVLMCNPWPSAPAVANSNTGSSSSSGSGNWNGSTQSSSGSTSNDGNSDDGDGGEYDSDGYMIENDLNQAYIPRAAVAFFKLEESSSASSSSSPSEPNTLKKRSFVTLTGLFGSSEAEEGAAFQELLQIEGLQKQRAVVVGRLLELITAFRDDHAEENVALGWLTNIRPILIDEFGVDVRGIPHPDV